MKNTLFVFFVLISIVVLGQTLEGKIVDKELNTPITYANITFLKRDKGTYSNENGQFKIDVKSNDSLIISSVGYKNKVIKISDFNLQNLDHIIKLQPEIEKLDEVVLTNKKTKYSRIKSFGDVKRGVKIKSGLPFGYEFANYIENSERRKGIIETVSIFLSKNKKFDYLSSFNIKFYTYNELKKQPGEPLYSENFIIQPLNKTYELEVDVSHLNIDFPANGICIGVEIINTNYEEPLNSMAYMAPYINFTHTNYKIASWGRYRNKTWTVNTRKSNHRKDFENARINIMAKIEK